VWKKQKRGYSLMAIPSRCVGMTNELSNLIKDFEKVVDFIKSQS